MNSQVGTVPIHDGSTIIVDEIPDYPIGIPEGRGGLLLHVGADGTMLANIESLEMPYDAVLLDTGDWLVGLILERAVLHLSPEGDEIRRFPAGGYPTSLQALGGGNFLVSGWDEGITGFVREFSSAGVLVWSIEDLRWPWKAERLLDGNTLIADAGLCRVFEVNSTGEEVWAVDDLGPADPECFVNLGPVYASRLDSGNTLVSIRGESRVVELDRSGDMVWEVGPPLIEAPYSAVRLGNGNTLIADQGHGRVVEITVDHDVAWESQGFGYAVKAYRL